MLDKNGHHTLDFAALALHKHFLDLNASSGGYWDHYKGGFYKVDDHSPVTMHTETGELMVNYRYGTDVTDDPTMLGGVISFSRPLVMWMSTVPSPFPGEPGGQRFTPSKVADASNEYDQQEDDAQVDVSERVASLARDAINLGKSFVSGLMEQATKAIPDKSASDAWQETAASLHRDSQFYRGLLEQVAKYCGDDVFIQDDGGKSDSPLMLKIPELVAQLFNERASLRAKLRIVTLSGTSASDPAPLKFSAESQRGGSAHDTSHVV
jgi:hypothetical protein